MLPVNLGHTFRVVMQQVDQNLFAFNFFGIMYVMKKNNMKPHRVIALVHSK